MSHPVPTGDREPVEPATSAAIEEPLLGHDRTNTYSTETGEPGYGEPDPGRFAAADTSFHEETPHFADTETTELIGTEPRAEPVPLVPAARPVADVAADLAMDRESVLTREKERFGGMKVGSAFLGWMAAAGVAVLLIALLAATGVALGISNHTTAADINNQAAAATGTARTIGLIGAIALLVIIFIAYYAGGYVAGRMARFNGPRQGLAVWLWSLLFAVVIAILVAVFGSRFNLLSTLNLPNLPVGQGNTTAAGIIGIAAVVVVSIGAALLGGAAGMLYHRKVDRAGLAV